MRQSDHANRPQWPRTPGFFEIWFLVVFDPAHERAWWFRYTIDAPAAGRPEPACATLWAAAFDRNAARPTLALKSIFPIEVYDQGPSHLFCVRMGPGELTNGFARGRVEAGGRTIAWELRFEADRFERARGPWLLRRLPLPTRVAHANSTITCRGWVEVDGVRQPVADAPAVQKHIWGTRRVEHLSWLYCPTFAEDARTRLECSTVRVRRGGGLASRPLTQCWLTGSECEDDWSRLPALLWSRAEEHPPEVLRFRAASATRAIRVEGRCDPRTLVGWVYRDPAGWDAFVAHSDLASCTVERLERPHPLARWRPAGRLTGTAAALEFHGPQPLPGVQYIAWDGTHLAGGA